MWLFGYPLSMASLIGGLITSTILSLLVVPVVFVVVDKVKRLLVPRKAAAMDAVH